MAASVVHALKCTHLKQVYSYFTKHVLYAGISTKKVSHRRLEFSDKFYLHLWKLFFPIFFAMALRFTTVSVCDENELITYTLGLFSSIFFFFSYSATMLW